MYACDSGTAVADPGSNPGLVADCKVLIAIRDELAGTGSLNWDTQLTMTSWQGVSVLGSPSRVQVLDLQHDQLTELILYGNQLDSRVPRAFHPALPSRPRNEGRQGPCSCPN